MLEAPDLEILGDLNSKRAEDLSWDERFQIGEGRNHAFGSSRTRPAL